MDINTLRTFLELVRTRHFGRTSEKLFITQSAVSARIRQIEDSLEVKLFIRDPRDIRLTEAGEQLVPFAESIVSGWEQARLKVAARGSEVHALSIGAVGSFWDSVLQDWFNVATLTLQHVQFKVDLESNRTLIQRVVDRSVDLAFLYDPPTIRPIVIEPVHVLRLRLYASSGSSSATDQRLSDRYILVDWGDGFMAAHHRLVDRPMIAAAKVDQGRIAMNMLITGGGSAYLPESLVVDHVSAGICWQIPDAAEFTREAFAIYRDDSPDKGLIMEAISNLRAFLGEAESGK